MYTDFYGKKRLKINLHTHTTLSDGRKEPAEAAKIYKAMGYDAVAFTDHWVYGEARVSEGLQILSGCEYNIGGGDSANPVFHIVGIDMKNMPALDKTEAEYQPGDDVYALAGKIVSEIRRCGGLVNLAHPAWSLNTPEMLSRIPGGYDVTEIFNSVSDYGMSDRGYSDIIVDQLAAGGTYVPLIATDDTHYYTGEQGRGFIMAEADACEELGISGAVMAGRFYASMGPEVHLDRTDENEFRVRCSPCSKIVFESNRVFAGGRAHRGENLTEATYTAHPERGDRYVRAVVCDRNGKTAWSNVIVL